jgi:hypothetical protein
MVDKRLRTGSTQGTRVHSDSPEDQQERRTKALQRNFGSDDVEMGRAIVERGRTVECAVEIDKSLSIGEQVSLGQKKFVGYDREGRSIYGPVTTHFGPGQEVVLPLSEIGRLRELGFLVDPRKVYNDGVKSQSKSTDEPHSRVVRPGEEHLPGTFVRR